MFAGTALLIFLITDSSARTLSLLSPFAPFVGFLAGYCWSVILHELGHYFAGSALGLRPFLVSCGHGDILCERHWFGVTWTLRAAPYSGYVCVLGKSSADPRWKLFVLTLAGPLANALLLILSGLILWSPPEWLMDMNVHENIQMVAMPFVLANSFIILHALYPSERLLDGMRTESDGLSMFRTACGRRKPSLNDPQKEMAAKENVSEKPDGSSSVGEQWSLLCKTVPAHYFLARVRYLLLRRDQPAKEEEMQKDCFITAVLMYAARRYFAEAERYSEELVMQNPSAQTLYGTRGSILVVNGRLEEGIAMLEKVYRESSSVVDQAISSAFLALAEFERNNLEEAVQWLEQAKQLDARFPCIAVIERLIGGKVKVGGTSLNF